MNPLVAIVGRANVGKSTLFNRLTQTRAAIIEDEPGVTRDRLYRSAEWAGKTFRLVDTGGIDAFSDDDILTRVRSQAELAIAEADLILFLVDCQTGITQDDEVIATILRHSRKKVILVVNKVHQFDDLTDTYEFYNLGMENLIPISALDGKNTGDLLDMVVQELSELPEVHDEPDDRLHIAVVGRPNVGKSSLCNALLGEERTIVSDVAGTTRDAIDSTFRYHGEEFVIVDTAGMRKRKKVDAGTERYSVVRSLRAVERADVVLMVIDADEGLIEQDKKIVGYVHEQGKGIIVVVNKWDLVEKDQNTMHKMEEKIKAELLFLSYAPLVFVSALYKDRIGKIMPVVQQVAENRLMRISTSLLNDIMREAVQKNPPPTDKGKRLKIFYATQTAVAPPTFTLFVNDKELMHFSYLRYLENRIRDYISFEGTSLKMVLRNRKEDE